MPDEQTDAPGDGPTPPHPFYDAPTEPIPAVSSVTELPEQCYDPSQPNQSPIAGIDLETFASVSRRLLDTPAADHAELLAAHGHTPASWSAVNTAWIARLGQMPFLLTTYTTAYRST
jgi:hypothetical protein